MEHVTKSSNMQNAKDTLWFKLFDAKRKLFHIKRRLKRYNITKKS
jgi:hypothetical protein